MASVHILILLYTFSPSVIEKNFNKTNPIIMVIERICRALDPGKQNWLIG